VHLLDRRHWIFDLDGTLTVAAHDFDAIRAELGLPIGEPILHARLGLIEAELADAARPQPGVHAFVEQLQSRGCRLGILTRNLRDLALRTLYAIGLHDAFPADFVLGRDEAAPKPSDAGIQLLLAAWSAAPTDAVMVGDYLFDLQAGRTAGVATVHFAVDRRAWPECTDRRISGWGELLC
jgi:phosphoglycolate phosphatase-like HAD superfamily hydrolase